MKILRKFWQWFDDRSGITAALNPLLNHPVPPNAKWMYVFGSATLFMFIIQVITGVGLALIYQPTSETAYQSLNYITNQAPLGRILRGIHFYAASAMIFLVGLHMIRVYLTASFKYPREMSWISGLVLLALTLAMGFTGQLLRWDSNGVWSAIVGAEQAGRIPVIGTTIARLFLGGDTLGGATLSRFFAFHVFLVPGLIFAMIGLHLYLVFKNGISEPPVPGKLVRRETYRKEYDDLLKQKGVPFWPDAAWRDAAFAIVVVFIVLAFAVISGPPKIGDPPDPSNIQTNPRPDWYFLWVFALFALMPPQIESFVIAFAPVVAGVFLLLVPVIFNQGERSPLRRPWSIAVVVAIITMVGVFWYEGTKSPWSPAFSAKPLTEAETGMLSHDAGHGAELFYSKACLYCHMIDGKGGKRGPDLSNVADRLTSEEMTIRIVNGGGNMPPFGPMLTDKELRDLVSFLETQKKRGDSGDKSP